MSGDVLCRLDARHVALARGINNGYLRAELRLETFGAVLRGLDRRGAICTCEHSPYEFGTLNLSSSSWVARW
jgi:hypothetical protein